MCRWRNVYRVKDVRIVASGLDTFAVINHRHRPGFDWPDNEPITPAKSLEITPDADFACHSTKPVGNVFTYFFILYYCHVWIAYKAHRDRIRKSKILRWQADSWITFNVDIGDAETKYGDNLNGHGLDERRLYGPARIEYRTCKSQLIVRVVTYARIFRVYFPYAFFYFFR